MKTSNKKNIKIICIYIIKSGILVYSITKYVNKTYLFTYLLT